MNDARANALAEWFSSHFGLITWKEAIALGLSGGRIRRLVESGAWVRVHVGVYRLAGAPTGGLSQLYLATLIGGERSLVSHRSAAWIHGMRDRAPYPLTVTIPHARCVTLEGVAVVRARRPPRAVTRKGLRCTAPIQTLMDCSVVASPMELDGLVDQALARKVIAVPDLERGAQHSMFRHHRGRQAFISRLAARGVTGAPNPSVLESRTARLIAKHGLPVPTAELDWIEDHRHYRLDFAYPDLRLVIEVDGWASHMSPEQQRHDNTRNNALSLKGWTVLHYNWWEITFEGDRVAAEILAAYRRLAA